MDMYLFLTWMKDSKSELTQINKAPCLIWWLIDHSYFSVCGRHHPSLTSNTKTWQSLSLLFLLCLIRLIDP